MMRPITTGSVTTAMTRNVSLHTGQRLMSISKTRLSRAIQLSGDTSFGADDAWLVTDDYSVGGGDPTTSFRWYGPGTVLTQNATFMTTTFTAAGNQGPRAYYQLAVAPGETVSLLWFSGMHTGAGSSINAANLMSSLDSLTDGDALLTGLSATQLAQTANWSFGATVLEPGTVAMLGLGLLALTARRRRIG